MKPTLRADSNEGVPRHSKTSSGSIKIRATLQALALGVLAWVLWWKFNKTTPPLILTGVAFVTFVCGWFIPAWFRAIDHAVHSVARLIGTAMTWILLVPFYYLFFGFARVCLVLKGKDPMCRRWDKTKTSYWVDRPPVSGPAHYTRQY